MPASLRVAIDATPLLGARTGIGVYVQNLIRELAHDPDVVLRASAFSLRGRAGLGDIAHTRRPVPARLLNRLWSRGSWPPAEWVMGRADVVHGTNYVLPPARRAAGVVSVHDLSFLHYPELVSAASLAYRELVPRSIERADAVLALSAAVASEIVAAYSVDPRQVHVVPLGVDPRWFARTPTRARHPGVPDRYLLALGTLEPRKGLDVLLAAYRLLLDDEPSAPTLVLTGAAGWGPELELSAIPRDKLILTGYVPADTAVDLVRRATALVYPSRYEGFGLPPLEALAAGTPVVASDLAVTREVLADFARLVPPEQPGALASALAQLLAEPPSAAQVAAGRAHAATFTWRRCAESTVAVYRSVVAARS